MPDKKSSDDADNKKGRGKNRMLIIGVLCVAIAAGGYVIGGRGSASAPVEETAEEAEETEPTIAKIVELDAVNVNLADGHYLRIAVALGLSEEALHADEDGGGHGGSDEFHYDTAPASDLVLQTFLGRHMDELATPEGRQHAREDLYHGLEQYYGEDIVTIFLTEFVMQ